MTAQSLTLKIDDVAFGGKGVGRSAGKAVFVPFTIAGEEAVVSIVRQKKKFAEAKLIEIIESSPHRVPPPCPYFTRCGGCAYQHIAYSHQLEVKSQQVEQTLRRVGQLQAIPMRPAIASPSDYGYRNRIRVHALGGAIGFYASDKYELIDIDYCPISSPEVNRALRDLRQRTVADGDYTLRGRNSGEFFEQTNPFVTARMLELISSLVRREQALLVDAYCGGGLFAKHLAPLFPMIIGIEENETAVRHARAGASMKETYFAADAGACLGGILQEHDSSRTTLIVDPPAVGLSARGVDAILGSRPGEVIYVSCNPATLARDLAQLARVYHVESVTPLDMFPQTAEIEAVVHLTLPR